MIHLWVIIMNGIYPELCNLYNLDLQDNTKTINTEFMHLTAEANKSK